MQTTIPNASFPTFALVLALYVFITLLQVWFIIYTKCVKIVTQAKGEFFKFVDGLSNWIVNIEANFVDGNNLVRIR